jgi:hypothetical protein
VKSVSEKWLCLLTTGNLSDFIGQILKILLILSNKVFCLLRAGTRPAPTRSMLFVIRANTQVSPYMRSAFGVRPPTTDY